MTDVTVRDCDNRPVSVQPGDPAPLRIQNTDLIVLPTSLPKPSANAPYSVALTVPNGVAPYHFTVSAGALPTGLVLSSSGVLSGTPSVTGPASFTVHVTDAGGVPGTRSYSVMVGCPVMQWSPSSLADGQVGQVYDESLVASGGTAPFTYALIEGTLPAGILFGPDGHLTGVPTAAGSSVLTFEATDAEGCRGRETWTLSVFADPAVSHIVPSTVGACLSASRTQVTIPFRYVRGDATPAGLAHVEFQIHPRFRLVTPSSPGNSIHEGSWFAAYPHRAFQVLDLGGGNYSVDSAILGGACGPDSGGVLFTVDLATDGGDGVGDLTVVDASVRGCDNQPLPVQPGDPAQLVVSHASPIGIADLAASALTSGNDTSGRTRIQITWTPPVSGRVELYRAPFGSYPGYDNGGGTAPDPSTAPGGVWSVVSTDATSGLLDVPPTRGFWHYVAFVVDSCLNRSLVSNMTSGALDYALGDVSDGALQGQGDNQVDIADVSLLGAYYGISGAAITSAGVTYLDVGPTTDGSTHARPTTDGHLDFDDLILFALNFETVSSPALRAQPAGPLAAAASAQEAFELEAPTVVSAGDEVVAELRVTGAGRMQGFSARLAWDAGVLEPLGWESAGYVESQGGLALSPRAGVVDAALLGVRGAGFSGQGPVARFRFRARREGAPALRVESVDARDAANHALGSGTIARANVPGLPQHDVLLAPSPNPARGEANLAFGLAKRGAVDLSIYSIDGRRVNTLAHGPREAGSFRIAWHGDDEAGHAMAPGIYWARLTIGEHSFNRRIVFLR